MQDADDVLQLGLSRFHILVPLVLLHLCQIPLSLGPELVLLEGLTNLCQQLNLECELLRYALLPVRPTRAEQFEEAERVRGCA